MYGLIRLELGPGRGLGLRYCFAGQWALPKTLGLGPGTQDSGLGTQGSELRPCFAGFPQGDSGGARIPASPETGRRPYRRCHNRALPITQNSVRTLGCHQLFSVARVLGNARNLAKPGLDPCTLAIPGLRARYDVTNEPGGLLVDVMNAHFRNISRGMR